MTLYSNKYNKYILVFVVVVIFLHAHQTVH